jgi:small subunit ribosomal protein S4e
LRQIDVITIEKTDEVFRLLYDTKGRFIAHRISAEESKYKLGKVRRVEIGKKGIPYLVTHDGRTIRYPDPSIKVHDTVKIDLETVRFGPQFSFIARSSLTFVVGNL